MSTVITAVNILMRLNDITSSSGSVWILETGIWNDSGVWKDEEVWID